MMFVQMSANISPYAHSIFHLCCSKHRKMTFKRKTMHFVETLNQLARSGGSRQSGGNLFLKGVLKVLRESESAFFPKCQTGPLQNFVFIQTTGQKHQDCTLCSVFLGCFFLISLFAIPQNNSTHSHSFNIYSRLPRHLASIGVIHQNVALASSPPNFLFVLFFPQPCSVATLFLVSFPSAQHTRTKYVQTSTFLRLSFLLRRSSEKRNRASKEGCIPPPAVCDSLFFCWLYFWVGFLCSTSPPRSDSVSSLSAHVRVLSVAPSILHPHLRLSPTGSVSSGSVFYCRVPSNEAVQIFKCHTSVPVILFCSE